MAGKYSALRNTLTRFAEDETSEFEQKVRKEKLTHIILEDQQLCQWIADLKRQKERIEEEIRVLNISVEAAERSLAERFETKGIDKLTTACGTFSIRDEPVVSFTDRYAFHEWIKNTGQEELFSVNYRTASGLVKEALIAGESLPPGTEVKMRVGINTRRN